MEYEIVSFTQEQADRNALGASPRLLRRVVRWHAVIALAGALAVALPAGAILGARVFRLVANSVGLVPTPRLSPLLLAGTVAGLLVLALAVAVWPSRRASRIDPGVLRAG